jgi:hypothetical protein
MRELVLNLSKRRKIIFYIIFLFSFLGILYHLNYTIAVPTYFEGKYNMAFAYGLIVYKLVELPTLYYILIHRHLLRVEENEFHASIFPKLKKQSKVLFFLIIQGNTIFGIISYKLSGEIIFFLLFMFIAFATTILIKPNKLFS